MADQIVLEKPSLLAQPRVRIGIAVVRGVGSSEETLRQLLGGAR